MKSRFFFLIPAVVMILYIILESCTPPVSIIDPPAPPVIVPVINVRVYNSAWDIVQEGYVERSRAVTTIQSYEDYVAEYNESNFEDQLFIVEGEEIIPIEDAPPADIYIAEYTTHDIIQEYIDWPRVDLMDNLEAWRYHAQVSGGRLYVDRVPPPPIPVIIIDDRPAYEKWALYLVYVDTGLIKNEEHCETEELYLLQKPMYELQATADGGTTYVIAGRLYP